MISLEQSQALCGQITRAKGPNFSVGFEVLPPEKKAAVHACYAFCRLVDDFVDEHEGPASADGLGQWRAELDRVYAGRSRDSVGVALADAVERYPIPKSAFLDLIQGCEEDLSFVPPADLAGLLHYCDLVATPIGVMSLAIFGVVDPRAHETGRSLSHALQVTNILRDVREDACRGRVYLPGEWMEEVGVSLADLASGLSEGSGGEGFLALMSRGIRLAHEAYERARELPLMVEEDSRAAVVLMAAVYEETLGLISREPERVLVGRVELSGERKREMVVGVVGDFV